MVNVGCAILFLLTVGYRSGYTEEKNGTGDVLSGNAIFHERCAVCHGVDGNALLPGAPSFATGERMEKTDEELLQTIRHGKDLMPPWGEILSEEERRDALSYVRVITGDKVFEEKCSKCHQRSAAPSIPTGIPEDNALKSFEGSLDVCGFCDIESDLTRDELLQVIRYIRALPKH